MFIDNLSLFQLPDVDLKNSSGLGFSISNAAKDPQFKYPVFAVSSVFDEFAAVIKSKYDLFDFLQFNLNS